MHNASHPEHQETNIVTYPHNVTLRERLLELRNAPGWSNNLIAKRIGCNVSVVSQYLSDDGCKYPGDIPKFEGSANDFLDNEARRRASGVETIKSDEAEQTRVALEYIRKTTDIGVILAESGDGKTRGQELYVIEHPTAILFRSFAWCCDRKSAETFMFEKAGRTGWDKQTKYVVHAVTRLRGSERLIIVDDAHFLHRNALQWWVHFHEATQMPLALCGTYALLNKIEDDAQIFSRVGLKFEIKQLDGHGKLVIDRALIKHMIQQLAPTINGELPDLCDLCEQVAREHGHYRSVHKQLKVAVELKSGNRKLSYTAAFKAAHTMLIRNYTLS